MRFQHLREAKIRLFQELSGRPALWLGAVLVAGFIAFYLDSADKGVRDVREPEDVETAATFIPAGFVLVPIEVSNFESLDSILGKHGVVDLYVPGADARKRPVKVAERIRILRAPLNPSHFAVLAPEAESPKLVSHPGPFLVVVQPSSSAGTKFVNVNQSGTHDQLAGPARKTEKKSGVRRSRIEIEVGNPESAEENGT